MTEDEGAKIFELVRTKIKNHIRLKKLQNLTANVLKQQENLSKSAFDSGIKSSPLVIKRAEITAAHAFAHCLFLDVLRLILC